MQKRIEAEMKKKGLTKTVRKRPQVVEQHFDDCGSDLTPILWASEEAGGWQEDDLLHEEYDCSPESSNFVADMERLEENLGMIGSTGRLKDAEVKPEAWCESKQSFLQAAKRQTQGDDVAEICGGEANSTRLLVSRRRETRAGPNFDLTTGVDLTIRSDVHMIWQYIFFCMPWIIIMVPPCRGFLGFAPINRKINRAGWERSMLISIPLARLCGAIALWQMSQGRHFIVEQPAGSEMFRLEEWQKLAEKYEIALVRFDQCQVGLVGRKTGLPIKKRTELWASEEELVRRFRGRQCDGTHQHARLGYEKGKPCEVAAEAQVWPTEMCRLIAAGCASLLGKRQHGESFPVIKKEPTTHGQLLPHQRPKRSRKNPRLRAKKRLSL